MITIYVDVLIILNIYVNYLLVKTTAKITHSHIKLSRCISASVYGSIYSLMILLPEISTVLNIAIKLFASATIILIAFGNKNIQRYIINSLSFLAVNLIFAGAIYAVYMWLKPEFVHFNNTYFYVDFSLLLLIISTATLYFAVCLFRFIFDRIPQNSGDFQVLISYKGENINVSGLADTGNSLVDFFTGNPVIICGKNKISHFFESDNSFGKFRVIPYSTINCSDGMIPVFRPDSITIINSDNGFKKDVEAMIGVIPENNNAIFNPKMLRL